MGKSSIPAPAGEVVLVQKPVAVAEPPKIREISQKQYEKLRPKKPLSEKQQENLKKLVERNKQRAVERRAVVTNAVPDVVPEDQELVIVKPKRKYTRKPKEEPKNEIIQPSDTETATESESEPEVRRPVPLKRTNTPKPKPKKATKKPVKYKYETETTSNDEWSDNDNSDDEDYEDPRVQKYQAKAQARIHAVQQIDQRLQQLKKNPYENRNLGVF